MEKELQNSKMRVPQADVSGTIRDFILPVVEFLGILVPGIIFIFAFFPAVIFPLKTFFVVIGQIVSNAPMVSDEILVHIISPSFGALFILLAFSYVVGHLFFRQDPKIPDEHSFKRVKETIKEEGPVRLGEEERRFNAQHNLRNEHNLEFPYRYLKEYLNDRGMKHLAKMVPWSGNSPDSYRFRTKHFINVLKVRLEFLFPYQYLRIQRNEAHVRLMSSMWYAGRTLMWVACSGVLLGMLSVIITIVVKKTAWPVTYAPSVIIPFLVFFLSLLLKRYIESFLHYQRIREIVFIMETAYFAQEIFPEYKFTEQ